MGIKVSAGVGMKIWLLPTDTQVVVRSISLSGELYAGVQFMWNFLMEWLKERERKKESILCVCILLRNIEPQLKRHSNSQFNEPNEPKC